MNSQHIHRLSPCKLGARGWQKRWKVCFFFQVSPTCCTFPKGREPFGVALKDGVPPPPPPPPSVRGSLAHRPVSTGKYALHRNHTSKQVNRNLLHLEREREKRRLSLSLFLSPCSFSSISLTAFSQHMVMYIAALKFISSRFRGRVAFGTKNNKFE